MFNGNIICKSKEGQGSSFIFIVELSQNQCTNMISNRIMNPNLRKYNKILFKNCLPNDAQHWTQNQRAKKHFGSNYNSKMRSNDYDISKNVSIIMKEN